MLGSLRIVAPWTAHGGAALPNDGLVTVESARWGTFMGSIPADHLDQVGFPVLRSARTGFDFHTFYRTILPHHRLRPLAPRAVGATATVMRTEPSEREGSVPECPGANAVPELGCPCGT